MTTRRFMRLALGAALAAPLAAAFALALPQTAEAGPRLNRFMALADADGDRAVTRAEFRKTRVHRFPALDRNNNGVLDQGDARRDDDPIVALINGQDANNDGVVTVEELAVGPTPGFDAADANGDGALTGSEIEVFVARLALQ